MLQSLRMTVLAGITMSTMPFAGVVADESEPVQFTDNAARLSYSLGYQIGGDFKSQGVEMNADAVVMGIEDAMSEANPKIPPKAMYSMLAELKRKVVAEERKNTAKATASRERELGNIAEGQKFLKENAEKPGVKTTKSGLQYKIIEPGSDKKPGPKDVVTVNYRGTLVNGREFDSSYSRNEPSTIKLDAVIPGWMEGLQLIGEGGKIQLFVPHTLAYRGTGPLAHRTLIFDVELISVGGDKQATTRE